MKSYKIKFILFFTIVVMLFLYKIKVKEENNFINHFSNLENIYLLFSDKSKSKKSFKNFYSNELIVSEKINSEISSMDILNQNEKKIEILFTFADYFTHRSILSIELLSEEKGLKYYKVGMFFKDKKCKVFIYITYFNKEKQQITKIIGLKKANEILKSIPYLKRF